jgi:uncharacterized caspase-like protein
MTLLCVGLALCAVLLAGCATGSRGAPARLALVIGNAAYENVVPLKNPSNDAADMCAALGRLGFKTLCHTNVRDRVEFDARVTEYVAQLGENSVGVFYYSGHGVQAGNANYLIPTQVQFRSATENPTRVLYNVDDLFDRLGKKRTKFQLVMLDACRDDLFSPPPRQTARAPAGSAAPDVRSVLVRALQGVAGASNGLQPIKDAPSGTMVLYATASKDVAFDGDGRNGPLTKHILAHIGTRGIPVEEFFKRVTLGVELETFQKFRIRKTPFIYGSFSGKFCFAGCPGDNDVPIPPLY